MGGSAGLHIHTMIANNCAQAKNLHRLRTGRVDTAAAVREGGVLHKYMWKKVH